MTSPAAADVSALLGRLEPLSHSQRWKEMVQVGRISRGPAADGPALATVLSLASSQVHYERLLGAMAMRGAAAGPGELPPPLRDACLKLFSDASPTVRNIVRGLLVDASTDAQLVEILRGATARQFRELCAAVEKAGRIAVLQTLYAAATAEGTAADPLFPTEQVALLAGYMPATRFTALSADNLSTLTPGAVAAVTARDPAAVVAHLVATASAMQSQRTAGGSDAAAAPLTNDMESVILTALETVTAPEMQAADRKAIALQLAEGTLHLISRRDRGNSRRVKQLLPALLSMAPLRFAQYLKGHKEHFHGVGYCTLSRATWRELAKEPETAVFLVGLGIRGSTTPAYDFGDLPMQVRSHYWEHHQRLFSDRHGVVPVQVVEHLPDSATRMTLARKMFAAKSLQAVPESRLPYLRVLPFPEARKLAEPFTTDPDAQVRIATASALARTVRYHPQHLNDVLDHFIARAKEQDPYRSEVFGALAELPPSRWVTGKADTQKLATVLQAALDAKDVSRLTLTRAEEVLVRVGHLDRTRLMPFVAKTLKAKDDFTATTDLSNASNAVVDMLAEVLLAYAEAEMRRSKNTTELSTVISILGERHVRRMWNTHIRRLVDDAAKLGKLSATVFAIECYRKYDRSPVYLQMVQRVAAEEPAWLLNETLLGIVASVMQGPLLERAIAPLDMEKLRSSTKERLDDDDDTYFTPLETQGHARRWTARQQNTFAATLCGTLDEKYAGDKWRVARILNMVAAMPSVDVAAAMAPFAALDYKDVFVRDTTLSVMGQMRDAASMHILLDSLNDARVSTAVVAVQRRLRDYPAQQAIDLLQPLLLSSKGVSVQKQLVRFIGDLGTNAAYQCLCQFSESKGDDMHGDVRIALGSAWYRYLDKPEVWNFFDSVAASERAAEVASLASIPDAQLRATWQLERMNGLLRGMIAHSDSTVKTAALMRMMQFPMRLEDPAIYTMLLDNLSSSKREPILLSQSLTLITKFRSGDINVAAQRLASLADDSVLRKAVGYISGIARSRGEDAQRTRARLLAAQLADLLIAAGRQPTIAADLVILSGHASWVEKLTRMHGNGLLHPGAAHTVVESVTSYMYAEQQRIHAVAAFEAGELRGHALPLLRRVGLAIVDWTRNQQGWTDERRAAIEAYREDADAWVRDDARLVTMPDDDESASEHDASGEDEDWSEDEDGEWDENEDGEWDENEDGEWDEEEDGEDD